MSEMQLSFPWRANRSCNSDICNWNHPPDVGNATLVSAVADRCCNSDIRGGGRLLDVGNAAPVFMASNRWCISDDWPSIPFAGVFAGGGNAAPVLMVGNRCCVSDVHPLDLAANVGYAAMAAMVPHWRNERCKSDVKRKRGALHRGALGAAQGALGRCTGGYSIDLPDAAPTWRSFLQTRLLPHFRAHFWVEKCCNLRVCLSPRPEPLHFAGLHRPAP